MKHVVVFNQFALPSTEGGGTRHIDLFGRLRGWSTTILAGNRNHYSQQRFGTHDPRFWLVKVPRQRGSAIPRLFSWVAYSIQAFVVGVTRTQIDLVYGSSPQPFAALAALVTARIRRVPFVLEVRDLWPDSIVSAGRLPTNSILYSFLTWLEKLLARNAQLIVCVTSGWEDHFVSLGVPSSRLVVIPNGTEPVDADTRSARDELRSEYKITGFTAVFAGAHGEKDGLESILDAAAREPAVNFLLIGDGPMKKAAVRRVDAEKLTNVEFRTPIPKAELPRLLVACDVGIHAVTPLSVFDKGMSPNKLFDYLAAGLPVVSNAERPLQQVLRDGECGPIGPPDSLADGLAAVRRAGQRQRTDWSEKALETISDRFSRARTAEWLQECLDEVAARRMLLNSCEDTSSHGIQPH